ncbi:hypothetical protein ZWY2020_009516 [Hordeum vulgare]|nr:hypothetical protein ZWY2020_009516 [Hordeum vulgare]
MYLSLQMHGASSPDIINTTCSSLSYGGYPGYDYCVSVLSSGSAGRDTRDLAIAATNATAHNITSTVKLIEGLLSDLAECKLSYGGRMGKTVASAVGDLVVGRALLVPSTNKRGGSSIRLIQRFILLGTFQFLHRIILFYFHRKDQGHTV